MEYLFLQYITILYYRYNYSRLGQIVYYVPRFISINVIFFPSWWVTINCVLERGIQLV